MNKFSNYNTSKKEKFIKFSSLRNRFLKNFIDKYYERRVKKSSRFEFKEIYVLLFLTLLFLRKPKSITETYFIFEYLKLNLVLVVVQRILVSVRITTLISSVVFVGVVVDCLVRPANACKK